MGNEPLSGCAASPFSHRFAKGEGTALVARRNRLHGARWHGLLRGLATEQAVRASVRRVA